MLRPEIKRDTRDQFDLRENSRAINDGGPDKTNDKSGLIRWVVVVIVAASAIAGAFHSQK